MFDNASLDRPEVLIQNLEAGKDYIATVIALNKKVIIAAGPNPHHYCRVPACLCIRW